MMKSNCFLFFLLILSSVSVAQSNVFPILSGTNCASIVYSKSPISLDSITANLLADDIERVTSRRPLVVTDIKLAKGNVIVIGNIQSTLVKQLSGSRLNTLAGKWECFGLTVIDKPTPAISRALVVAGSDSRGTAYGVFSISEKIGVSPLYWWADVHPKKQTELIISQETFISQTPSVKYRGIFINDEDWGLQPWAAKTFEPETNDIGPKTYARVFELLLRLKANLIWPAMHPSTKAFYHYPGNVKTAANYQIIIGSSHAEPMLRNNVSEWDEKTMGRFNYITNKSAVTKYWEDRIKESKGVNAIYSMGMRGVHDGQMEGIKTLDEAVPLTEKIIKDERDLLTKYLNPDITKIPQVLTPYKEVLEIYDKGLKVPEDITLVWPDDNYGYVNRLNNEEEKKRKGSSGVYYHVSYWGRPHDYLWLPSANPSLMREEMVKSYETGADRLWVVNVGDIKPLEYNIQLFLAMAYDIKPFRDSRFTAQYLNNWSESIFGKSGGAVSMMLKQYYQLAFERRPEFMGWSQTEPSTNTRRTEYNHFYYGDEGQKRIDAYNTLELLARELRLQINPKDVDAYYQLVYYPIVCASLMNKKFLYADKSFYYAAQNRVSAFDYAGFSKNAYDSILKETAFYNEQLSGGKWKNIMSMKPRDLSVYKPPVFPDYKIDSSEGWSIAPEGFVRKDSLLRGNKDSLSLPVFNDLIPQQYFVDIFLTTNKDIDVSVATSHPWLATFQRPIALRNETGKKEARITVNIDWSKAGTEKEIRGVITFSAGGKQIRLNVTGIRTAIPAFQGFVETNGYISMHAAHFTRKVNGNSKGWEIVDGPGYSEKSLQALPVSIIKTISDSLTNAPFAEYDFYTFSVVNPVMSFFALPTHPVNNIVGARFAASVDGGPIKIIDLETFGRSEEWKQNVLRNRAEKKMDLPAMQPGKHSLRIYMLDPGVILDEIRIDLGGLKKAYSNLTETFIRGDELNR